MGVCMVPLKQWSSKVQMTVASHARVRRWASDREVTDDSVGEMCHSTVAWVHVVGVAREGCTDQRLLHNNFRPALDYNNTEISHRSWCLLMLSCASLFIVYCLLVRNKANFYEWLTVGSGMNLSNCFSCHLYIKG